MPTLGARSTGRVQKSGTWSASHVLRAVGNPMLDRHVGVGHRPRIGFTRVIFDYVVSLVSVCVDRRASDPAAQRRIIEVNHPGESAGRMKTTHPALTEGGVMAHAPSVP